MRSTRLVAAAGLAAAVAAGPLGAEPAGAAPAPPLEQPVAYGTGGAAATMSAYATAAAVRVLRRGGNAVDAAVAAAAMLGVTEPFVAGPGGGGFFEVYRARDHRVSTIDGRETAPAGATPRMFLDARGQPLPFEQAAESGVSVGAPGNVATWAAALRRFGTRSLASLLAPAETRARRGFPPGAALVASIATNEAKLAHFPAAAALYLPGGAVPAPGYLLRNPDLARTYAQIARHGARWFYTGPIARELAATARAPRTAPGTPAVASQRNAATTDAEPDFVAQYGAALEARGQAFKAVPYIGIVAALAYAPHGRIEAVTEPSRGGGGSAMVVRPENPAPAFGARVLAVRR